MQVGVYVVKEELSGAICKYHGLQTKRKERI